VRNENCQQCESCGGARPGGARPGSCHLTRSSESKSEPRQQNGIGSTTASDRGALTRADGEEYFPSAAAWLSASCPCGPDESTSQAACCSWISPADSSSVCDEAGSQTKATRTTKMFFKCRTPDIDAGRPRNVQSNLFRTRKRPDISSVIISRSTACICCRCRRGTGRCGRPSGRCGRAWPWPAVQPHPPPD
jgi:hypothetical protein